MTGVAATGSHLEWRHLSVKAKKLRQAVLQTAHNTVAGHLGVKKTYDRVLHYFYSPKLKRDISAYIKTCPVCQVIGKPNQANKPSTLCPIPAVTQPFEHGW